MSYLTAFSSANASEESLAAPPEGVAPGTPPNPDPSEVEARAGAARLEAEARGRETQAARVADLHRRRDLKMARSPHAYVRGSTASFYDWVNSSHGKVIPEGPSVWICGDAHVGNLGPIARCDTRIEVELRDLDQTVLGNPAHDLVRLALSLAMASRSSALPGVVTARLCEELTSGYLEAFADPEHTEPSTDSAAVRFAVREALRRKWRHLHRERLGKTPRLRLGSRFLPLSDEERGALTDFLNEERVRTLVTLLECRDSSAPIRVLDAAFWVKGCSSLGLWRAAALVEVVGHGDHNKGGGYSLLDIKEAVTPVAPSRAEAVLPEHHGERVVRGTQATSPALGQRTLSGTVLGHEVFVRELLPQDLKLELEGLDDVEARATARALARIVGRAHARQLGEAERRAWRAELARASSRWLEAPGWLWASVVDLVGTHERAYLEHCRRFALGLEKLREAEVKAQTAVSVVAEA